MPTPDQLQRVDDLLKKFAENRLYARSEKGANQLWHYTSFAREILESKVLRTKHILAFPKSKGGDRNEFHLCANRLRELSELSDNHLIKTILRFPSEIAKEDHELSFSGPYIACFSWNSASPELIHKQRRTCALRFTCTAPDKYLYSVKYDPQILDRMIREELSLTMSILNEALDLVDGNENLIPTNGARWLVGYLHALCCKYKTANYQSEEEIRIIHFDTGSNLRRDTIDIPFTTDRSQSSLLILEEVVDWGDPKASDIRRLCEGIPYRHALVFSHN